MYPFRTFFTSFFLFVLSLCHAQYSDEAVLRKEMMRLGINIGKEALVVVDRNDEISVYETRSKKAFLIAVNVEYRKYMEDAVIAYSETNGFQGTESMWKKNLIKFYSEQLRELKKIGRVVTSNSLPFRLETNHHTYVAPLIKTIWGQDYPYNELCPQILNGTTHNLTGCVATALSQIMYFHKFPACGIGRFECGNQNGSYTVNFARKSFDWSRFQDVYPQTQTNGIDITHIAELMSVNAQAVSSKFNLVNTASNYIAARSILVNHWGYSPRCKFCKNSNMSLIASIILYELENKRPVLLSGGHHAFICDGFKDGYYHLNLGWRGAANGYYKFLLNDNLKNAQLSSSIVSEILFDIQPLQHQKAIAKIINVAVPGSLTNLLTLDEKKRINKLTITGTLNGQDIALLRKMLGATDDWEEGFSTNHKTSRWTGMLQELNLEQANFVKDKKNPYLHLNASEGRFTWKNKEYTIGASINSDFEKLLDTPLREGKGYRYTIYHEKPFIEFYTLPNAVSPFMFYNCQNLRTLILPKETKEILGNAFQWCSSLKSITLPDKTKYIETGAFRECYLLTDVKVNSKITETRHNLFPFKTSGRYGEKDGYLHKGIFENNNIHTCKGLIIDNNVIDNIKYELIY